MVHQPGLLCAQEVVGSNPRCNIWATSWQNQQLGCAPSEDSDQPGHPPSLIRVFAVRMKKTWTLSYPLSAQRRLIRLGGCPGWSESSLGAQPHCWLCHEAAHMEVVNMTLAALHLADSAWQSGWSCLDLISWLWVWIPLWLCPKTNWCMTELSYWHFLID